MFKSSNVAGPWSSIVNISVNSWPCGCPWRLPADTGTAVWLPLEPGPGSDDWLGFCQPHIPGIWFFFVLVSHHDHHDLKTEELHTWICLRCGCCVIALSIVAATELSVCRPTGRSRWTNLVVARVTFSYGLLLFGGKQIEIIDRVPSTAQRLISLL